MGKVIGIPTEAGRILAGAERHAHGASGHLSELQAGSGGLQLNRPPAHVANVRREQGSSGQCRMCEMNAAEEQGVGQQRGGRCGEATAVLGHGRTALASCE